uniref:Uncharacterized protein n=1 Tax=Lepeophtheirus salmonis TaxID=72036 RepID=A0A0K2UR64_LEPSM
MQFNLKVIFALLSIFALAMPMALGEHKDHSGKRSIRSAKTHAKGQTTST